MFVRHVYICTMALSEPQLLVHLFIMSAVCNDLLRHILGHVAYHAPDYLWSRLLHVLFHRPHSSLSVTTPYTDLDLNTLCRSSPRPLSFIVSTLQELCLPFDCSFNVSLIVDWGDHTTSRLDIVDNILNEQFIKSHHYHLRHISHEYSSVDLPEFLRVRVFRLPHSPSPATSSMIHFGHLSECNNGFSTPQVKHRISHMISLGNIGVESLEGAFMFSSEEVTFEASFNVSNVKNMCSMFRNNCAFNHINVRHWNVCNVTTMRRMFAGAAKFNAPLGNWNVSNVIDMSQMFTKAYAFNQPIGQWNVTSVTDMSLMFCDAVAFNQPIGQWNVTNVNHMSCMFYGARAFNQPIGQWNVANVTDMSYMFCHAYAFNQPVGQWNVRNVINMSGMFYDAVAFNQPIGDWDVTNVTNMSYMFCGASAFMQPLSRWNVANVKYRNAMFYRAFNQLIGGSEMSPNVNVMNT